MRLKTLLYGLLTLLAALALALTCTAFWLGGAVLWALAAFSAALFLLSFYICRVRVLELFSAVGGALESYVKGESPPKMDFPKCLDGDSRARDVCALLEQADRDRRGLQEAQHQLEAITRNLPGCVLRMNARDYRLLYVSSGCQRLVGFAPREVELRFGKNFLLAIRPEDRAQVERQLQEAASASCGECILRYRPVTADGRDVWLMGCVTLEQDAVGGPVFHGVFLDVTDEQHALDDLRISRERYRLILEQSDDVICEWDFATDRLTASPKWEERFGYPPPREKFTQRMLSSPNVYAGDLPAVRDWLVETRRGAQDATTADVRIRTAGGRFLWTRLAASIIRGPDGRPERAVGLVRDIDKERRELDTLRTTASTDPLTGIYNKSASRRLAEEYMAECGGKALCALMLLDVDNFKAVNDTRGHLYGDSVLCDIASRLQGLFRDSDVVGRVGGDEFMVFLRNLPSAQVLLDKADCVIKVFHQYFCDQMDCNVSCSLGLSLYPTHGETFNDLYRRADIALYAAKSQGKACWVLYSPELEGQEFTAPPRDDSAIRDPAPEVVRTCTRSDILERALCILRAGQQDPGPAVRQVLALVGERCNVSRIWVCWGSGGQDARTDILEWCAPGVPSLQRQLKKGPCANLEEYARNFDENGIFYCRDIRALPSRLRSILEAQEISSVLQCALCQEGASGGFVSFDKRSGSRYWTQTEVDTLAMISRCVGVFLRPEQLQTTPGRDEG